MAVRKRRSLHERSNRRSICPRVDSIRGPYCTPDGQAVVVQVDNRPVRVSRVDVEVRTEPPAEWCVVNRTGVMRPTFGGQAPLPIYAVCPHCRERQDLDGRPRTLTCQRCKKESPVDWASAF